MSKALYRKYRPTTLAEVIGQEQVTNVLSKSLASGKTSHAYLFIGPRGCGKTSVARIFAHEINHFDYQIEDDYVDIIEIDGASNRGIDNIRELREKVAIAPTKGKFKVYIIDEVHMLTKEAFNALLKTLEEPPAHAIFIMATTDAYKVPITITSRAQTHTFKLADHATMFKFLKTVCEKEGIKIDDDALDVIVKRGGGSFRDSLSLLDQISTLSDSTITKEVIISALGLPADNQISALLSEYQSGNVVKITTLLKELLSSGVKPETLAEEIINTIIENPTPALLPLLATLPDVRAPFPEAKLLLALLDNANRTFSGPSISRTKYQSIANNMVAPESVDSKAPESESRSRPRELSAEPAEATAPRKTIYEQGSDTLFNWDDYLQKIHDLNDAISAQLEKTTYTFGNNTLNIYPEKRITYTILSRDNNKRILTSVYSDIKIILHEAGTAPNSTKDPLVSKISVIMGGAEEVKTNGGNPF